jgi:hypothetical protein
LIRVARDRCREGIGRGRTLAGARLDGSGRSGAIKGLEVGVREKDGARTGRRRVKIGIVFGIVQAAGVIRSCFRRNHGKGGGEIGVDSAAGEVVERITDGINPVLEIGCCTFGEFVAFLQFLDLMFLVLEHCMHLNEKVRLLSCCHCGNRRGAVGHNRWWRRVGLGTLGFG